jgi:hypothetical protein
MSGPKVLVLDKKRTVEVTKDGLVYFNGQLKHQFLSKSGYYLVKLLQKAYRVHRLVALAFIDNPRNLPFINHKDGNKENNCVDNLEWCTQRENVHHALRTGLHHNPEVPVRGTCLETGKSLIFVSQSQAQEKTKAFQANISKCLQGIRKSAGGFVWEYVL